MKKTLLLAAALACSGAVAQRKRFGLVTSTYGAAIDLYKLVKAPIVTKSWIADTTRGLRVSEDNRVVKDYAGDCEVLQVGRWTYRCSLYCSNRITKLAVFLRVLVGL
jgi:hypothetical protein